MPEKVFVSYCHVQGDWVRERLIPVLKAGGVEVLFDERFEAGKAVVGQMDATQDLADRHVLVLSPEYLASSMCRHEMDRAVALDPGFSQGLVIPVQRKPVTLPPQIQQPDPLCVTLDASGEEDPQAWAEVLRACGGRDSFSAPDWLGARDEVQRYLERGQSAYLLVRGASPWRALLHDLDRPGQCLAGLAQVDLDSPVSHTRRGLVNEVLARLGFGERADDEDGALAQLQRCLEARRRPPAVAFLHFERAKRFDGDFFSGLRYLVDYRLLLVLFQSRRAFGSLVPSDDKLSGIDLKTVVLGGSR